MAATTLEAADSGTHALQRVLHHYVHTGRQCLSADEPSDEAIHAARKAIKKSRTALRLLRPVLGSRRFRRANRALRDAAQALNPLRDAHVLVLALQELAQTDPALQRNRAVTRLAAHLQQELAGARRRLNARSLRAQCRALARMERCARRWKLRRRGWSVLGPALRRIYRKGRRVLPTASDHPADAPLHEWRKQIKYLRYALRILAPLRPGPLRTLEKQAAHIGNQLGEAHDLALLQARAQALASANVSGRRQLLQSIERVRIQRAFAALVAGERLFQPRPREFEQGMAQAWRRWRRRHG